MTTEHLGVFRVLLSDVISLKCYLCRGTLECSFVDVLYDCGRIYFSVGVTDGVIPHPAERRLVWGACLDGHEDSHLETDSS